MKVLRKRQGKPIAYADGELVRVGDRVAVRQRRCLILVRRREGRVNYAPNYSLPIELEINDYGIGVLLDDREHLWFDVDPDTAVLDPRVARA